MSVVKEVGGPAVTAWCPVKRPREALIAMGSMDNSTNLLQLYGMDLTLPGREMSLRGRVHTSSRVHALSWSNVMKHQTTCSMGIIAGAMEDGTVSLWDANKVSNNDASLLGTITKHKGAVNTLQFNPRQDSSHLIASGGADGEVYITSIAKLNKPAIFAPGPSIAQPGNEITTYACTGDNVLISTIAWNNQAAFIVASGCQQGTTTIWDLKQKQPWCQLHDPNRAPVSAIAWSPHEGLQVITASMDDNNPVVRLWDLRGSRTTPFAEFTEHRAGILSVAWCPHDAGYVLTSARDNRTLLWDVNSNQLAFEVYDQQDDGNYYGFQRSYLQWSPHQPGIFSASAPDRTQVVGINGMVKSNEFNSIGVGRQGIYSPEWVAEVTKAYEQPSEQIQSMSNEPNLSPTPSAENPIALIDGVDTLEQRGGDGDAYCDYKTHQDPGDVEWGFLKILFSEDARKQLLLHLGFDEDQIAVEASRYMGDSSPVQSDPSLAEDPSPIFTKQSEEIIKRSLLVGNFEAAVECCLRHNQLANALLLATCGGPELWHRTQEAFFKQQQRPFMKIVAAIIKNELATLVLESDLTRWKETLAILSTYSKSEEFPSLCDQLAVRLYNSGDVASAALCFICAMNMDRAIAIWVDRVNTAAQSHRPLAVLNAVEKVTVFAQATGQLSNAALPLYSEYAYLMLSIGQFDIAAKYGKHDPNVMEQLRQGSVPPQHHEPKAVSQEAYNRYAESPKGEVMQQFVPQQHNVHHYEHPKSPKEENLNYDNEVTSMNYAQPVTQESFSDFPVDGGHNAFEHGYNAYDQPNSQEPVYQSDFEHVQPPSNEFDMTAQANVYPSQNDPYQNDMNVPNDGYQVHSFGDDVMQPNVQEHHEDHHQPAPLAPPPSSELRVDTSAPPRSNDGLETELQTPSPDLSNTTPKQVLLNPVRTKPQAAPKTPPAPVAAPAQPYVTSVDLSSVSEDDIAIVRAVSDILGVLEVQKLPAMEAKQLGDIKKASDILFTKLNSGELGDVVLDLVHDMAGALAARDIKHAQQVHVILTKDHWTKQKDWLKGLKAMIQISIKRIR
ncbi:hypothetical protein THRCLA_21389 [Thraustotheca clavata]|uniref:Uncharacterized protein n=1 Tax=Thraustotheca clavata TaxID=74557 RepID=A0A1V9ZX68_9STRA|nr:hypothetical protein THRCLA_21389 [Thraustotheca clavata]